jgi:saccharopine dehydrogenase-like NADP-dependent oxidoreductase
VRDVRWRLALPPAIADGFKLLADLGLASTEPVGTSAGPVSPREVVLGALATLPKQEGPPTDVEATVVRVAGTREGSAVTVTGEVMTRPVGGISAGAFGTALPLTVAARWLAEGRVEAGVHPAETALKAEPFLDELAERGMSIRLS